MKNSLKKCLALLVAMVMVFAMTTAVFASEDGGTTSYTITINGKDETTNINTYTAYKVASFTVTGNAYVDLEVLAPFTAATTVTELENTIKGYDPDQNPEMRNYARKLAACITADTVNKGTGTTSITVDSTGYYLLVETAHNAADANIQSRYILVPVDGDKTVTVKVSKPSITKKIVLEDSTKNVGAAAAGSLVDSDVVAIGDTITYELRATIPEYSDDVDTDSILFMITDTMSEGLTYQSISGVKLVDANGAYVDSAANVGYKFFAPNVPVQGTAGEKFEMVIDPTVVKANPGKQIVVRFTATLNQNAQVDKVGNPNSVDLTYTNKWDTNGESGFTYPEGDKDIPEKTPEGEDTPKGNTDKTDEDTVITYTGVINVTKKDAQSEAPLAGAEFQIKDGDTVLKFVKISDGVYKYDATVQNSPLSTTIVNTVVTSTVTTTTTGEGENATTTTTGGTIKITGMNAGTYSAVETKAPEGYKLDSNPQTLTLSVTGFDGGTSNVLETVGDPVTNVGNANAQNTYKVTWSGNGTNVTIGNTAGITLPGTGGIGTTLFTLGGLAMVILAGVMFIAYTRKQKKQA